MMAAAVAEATEANQDSGGSDPVLVNANPKTMDDAVTNLHAFSTQGRFNHLQPTPDVSLVPISSLPRMRQCYGWMAIQGQVFRQLPTSQRPPSQVIGKLHRSFPHNRSYTAIVYEYVEEGENIPAAVEAVTDFLWLAGFSYGSSPLAQNWKSGVLVDLSDIVHPLGFGWRATRYGPKKAAMMLRE